MIEGWSVVALALGYVSILFALAWYADRAGRFSKASSGRPVIYALSLAVYCTSWTFFGSVGNAASTGYDFIPVYLGPILLFVLGWPFLLRIVRLAKSQNITSVADFLAARYGKSQAVAAIVTVIAVAGTLPYIALQLKAVALSVDTLLGSRPLQHLNLPTDTAFIIAMTMATFAVLFGTRHIDATEHQEGLIVAVAAESLVKLAAFLAVGFFVTFSMLGGIGSLIERVQRDPEIHRIFAGDFHGVTWLTVTFLSLVAILLLPRQFHVTVVENNSEREIRRAAWLFPVYLVLINLFVVPIAAAGLLSLPRGSFDADTLCSPCRCRRGRSITLLAFVAGSRRHRHGDRRSVALAMWSRTGGAAAAAAARGESQGHSGHDGAPAHHPPRRHLRRHLLGYLFYRMLGHTHAWRPSAGCRSRRWLSSPGLSAAWSGATRRAAHRRHRLQWRCGPTLAAALDHQAGWASRSILSTAVRVGFLVAAGPTLPPAGPSQPRRLVQHGRQRGGVRRGIDAEGSRADRASAGPDLRAADPLAAAHVAVVSALAHLRHRRRPAAHGGALPGSRARRALVQRIRRKPQCADLARCGSRHPPAALHRASPGQRHRCRFLAPRAVPAAAPCARRQPIGAAPARRCPEALQRQPRPQHGARSGATG
jgi:hypothetical protein